MRFALFLSHPSRDSCFLLLFECSNCSGNSSIDGLLGPRVLRSCSFGGGRILLSFVVRLSECSFLLDEDLTGLLVRRSLFGKCLGLSLSGLVFSDCSCMLLLLFCLFSSRLGCVLGRLCGSQSSLSVDLGLDTAHIFAVLRLIKCFLRFRLS